MKTEPEAIIKVVQIAKRLHALLREYSLHRLCLYQKYAFDTYDFKWTPVYKKWGRAYDAKHAQTH